MKKAILATAAIAIASTTEPSTIIVNTKTNNGFEIQLAEYKTAGYSCELSNYDENIIIPNGTTSQKTSTIGSPEQKTWSFRTTTTDLPQVTYLTISCARPWEKDHPKNHTYKIIVS